MATVARVSAVVASGGLILALELRLRGDADVWTQVAGQLVAFGLFLPAALICWRGLRIGVAGVVLVLVFAVCFRAVAFEPSATPPLSNDLHRYAWDARVQAAGINPYRYPPVSPALERLRDGVVWPEINLPAWRTVYPPGAEASFLLARGVFGSGLRATTWLFLAGEAATVALLLLVLSRMGSRPPLERVALYAWHPLALSEITANGHVDALAVVALAALLAAWQARRFVLAGLAVAVAALVKLGPLLLVPALARRGGWRYALPALAVCVLAYVPYLSVGTKVFGDLRDYVSRQRFGGSIWWALEPHLGRAGATAVCALVLLAVLGIVALRQHDSIEQVARSCLLVLGTLILTVSYVQPWHALWLLPFLPIVAAPGWLWLTGTLPLLYLFGLDRVVPDWVRVVVYGGLAVFVVWNLVARRRRAPVPLAPLGAARVAAAIPALNEAESLPRVLAEFPRGAVDEVIVVDGGSVDRTADAARAAGARVVVEPRRGYGRACATGAEAADAEVIVFLDGDGSDDPAAIARLVAPVSDGRAALALGARTHPERGAMHPHQRLGNRLVARLVRLVYGVPVHDVPPMRAIRRDVLERLELRELSYGWPTEMMVKTARAGLPIVEVEVPSRPRRGGESKIAGRAWPSVKAGAVMLAVVARYA
jgi:Glycosyl transferase family 2/Glycosyltransferase family 87